MKAYLTVQCQAHCIQYSRPGELYREDCYIHTTRGTMGLFFLFVSTLAICLVCLTPTVHSFTVTSKFNVKCRMTLRNISRVLPTSRVPVRMAESDEEFDENSNDVDDVSDEVLDVLDTEIVPEVAVEEPEVPKEVELDPYEVAVKALEAQLKSEVLMIESLLKSERNSLSKIKDKASESGKNGYFIVQAKVAEFQKNKAVEQKMRVTKNKREFVMKMLPVVDAFRAAPGISPAETEREDSMHKNFGSLLSSILVVFEKYGYKEYDAGKLPSRVLCVSWN